MNIRNKILLSFSIVTILLVAAAFLIVYWLFSGYREEEFQQQQNEKIYATIELINRFKKQSEEISYIMDAQDIHDFYDEKLLIYDSNKELIFSSLDDLNISKRKDILNELSPGKRWIETKEGDYDLVGVYLESRSRGYYAISKAYDALGYDKLSFLRKLLIIIFVIIVASVLLTSLYLANNLAKPINRLAFLLKRYNFSEENTKLPENKTSTRELQYLTEHFNELLQRTRDAFTFQKNTINHISHQLKTPVAVLVSELEKMQQQEDIHRVKEELKIQTERAKSLGDIISTLLEIAKVESGTHFQQQDIRMDELLFDLLEHFKNLYPSFHFQLIFHPESFTEQQMGIRGNALLLKQLLENLLHNCILYSEDRQGTITIDASLPLYKTITITNKGNTISEEEQQFLFRYFFRGRNSRNKSGNGLGLVLAQKIAEIHGGRVTYSRGNDRNTFILTLPAGL